MKKAIIVTILIMTKPLFILAQWPGEVNVIPGKGDDSVTVSGDLATGKIIEDLSWASSSSNACFVALQNSKFRGKHVFFATIIPPHSIMNISVKPVDETADLSMYAYMSVMSEHYLVPDLPKCITCEADYKWDGVWKGKVQSSERKIEFNNPTNGPFNILIGVTAPKGVNTGEFSLVVKVKS